MKSLPVNMEIPEISFPNHCASISLEKTIAIKRILGVFENEIAFVERTLFTKTGILRSGDYVGVINGGLVDFFDGQECQILTVWSDCNGQNPRLSVYNFNTDGYEIVII